jgi:hypothetical protein
MSSDFRCKSNQNETTKGIPIADMCIIVAIELDGALSQILVGASPRVSLENSSYASQARPMD